MSPRAREGTCEGTPEAIKEGTGWMDVSKYIISVKVPDSVCMIPATVTAFNLFHDIWVCIAGLGFVLFVCISLRPIGGARGTGQGGSPSPD